MPRFGFASVAFEVTELPMPCTRDLLLAGLIVATSTALLSRKVGTVMQDIPSLQMPVLPPHAWTWTTAAERRALENARRQDLEKALKQAAEKDDVAGFVRLLRARSAELRQSIRQVQISSYSTEEKRDLLDGLQGELNAAILTANEISNSN